MNVFQNHLTGGLSVRIVYDCDSYELLCKIADINHPNLMRIQTVNLYDDRCEAICEYVEGVTLEQMIQHEGVCSPYSASRIMMQVCDGLSALHMRGIVHRDIKPSNVMIDSQGKVKIVDYDISRTIKLNQSKDTRILGSVGYTSPEQFGFSQTDAKADIYSCGVLLNFLLTGARPDEEMVEGPMREIVEQCIQIDKSKRFENVELLEKSLKRGHVTKTSRFLPLPGFRGTHVLPKIISSILLIDILIFTFLGFDHWVINNDSYVTYINSSPGAGLRTWLGFCVFMFIIPYLFIGDFGYMSELICKRKPKRGKAILIILAVISFFFGIFLTTI